MIKIFGSPMSSSGRCFWALEECGVAYERMPLNMGAKEHKSPAYLELNPNGKVPCIQDGGFVLWESMAINHYLAEKYRPALLLKTPEEHARIQQWSFWALAELQPPFVDILIQKMFVPEDRRNHDLIQRSEAAIPGKLQVLEQHLVRSQYIAGNEFSLADINVGSVVNIAQALEFDLSAYPNECLDPKKLLLVLHTRK